MIIMREEMKNDTNTKDEVIVVVQDGGKSLTDSTISQMYAYIDELKTLGKSQKSILKCFVKNPYMTAKELSPMVKLATISVYDNITKLKSNGIIIRIGKQVGGYWYIDWEKIAEMAAQNDAEEEDDEIISPKYNENKEYYDNISANLPEISKKIFKYIVENPHIMAKELSVLLGVAIQKITVYTAILKENGLIEREGSNRYGSWKVATTKFEYYKNKRKNSTKNLSDNQRNILKTIEKNPYITTRELSNLAGIKLESVRVYFTRLKSKGLVKRMGRGDGGCWEITEDGVKLMNRRRRRKG